MRIEGIGYVYKYVDRNDGDIKYVGLVNVGKSLTQRIKQHEHENWYHDNFDIYYSELNSKTDCEFVEAHLIEYYHTYEYYNKAKSHWGESKYIDATKLKWKKYLSDDILQAKQDAIKQSHELDHWTKKRYELKQQYDKIRNSYLITKNNITDILNKREELKSQLSQYIQPISINELKLVKADTSQAFTAQEVLLFYRVCKDYDINDICFEACVYNKYGKMVIDYKITYNEIENCVCLGNATWISEFNTNKEHEFNIITIAVSSCMDSYIPNKDIYNLFVCALKKAKEKYKTENRPLYFNELLEKYYKDGIPEREAKSTDGECTLECLLTEDGKISFKSIRLQGTYIIPEEDGMPDGILDKLKKYQYWTGMENLEYEQQIYKALVKFDKEKIDIEKYIA